jgi:endonuclease YncB( thermonuclease family)
VASAAVGLVLGLGGACTRGGGCTGTLPTGRGGDRVPAAVSSGLPETVVSQAPVRARRQPPLRQPAAAATVVRVRDGDSLVVLRGGVEIEVRLDGVDCPELEQAFGRRARRFTSDLGIGREVRVAGRGRDDYGRELAEIFLPDGRSLNRELVAAGFAWWFRRYSTDPTLEALEREARAARRGLWADPDPIPPWDYRKSRGR